MRCYSSGKFDSINPESKYQDMTQARVDPTKAPISQLLVDQEERSLKEIFTSPKYQNIAAIPPKSQEMIDELVNENKRQGSHIQDNNLQDRTKKSQEHRIMLNQTHYKGTDNRIKVDFQDVIFADLDIHSQQEISI